MRDNEKPRPQESEREKRIRAFFEVRCPHCDEMRQLEISHNTAGRLDLVCTKCAQKFIVSFKFYLEIMI